MKNIEFYMSEAIKEAKKALLLNEIPVGAVLVKGDEIIARGHNTREIDNLITSHAEINALIEGSKILGSWKLPECDLYVTLEPCIMCAGAILQARINNLYFGAFDPNGGAFSSSINVLNADNINHKVNVYPGILKDECSELLTTFFNKKRNSSHF